MYHHNERIASHLRDRTASGYTTKKEHLPSDHQFYLDWSPDFFISKAQQIGPYTTQYVERLFTQSGYAETKYKTAMGIVQLTKYFDKRRIEKGCQLAIMHPVSSYQRLLHILEKGIDQSTDLFENQMAQESHIPSHENIRGADYYLQQTFLNQTSNHHASDN